MIVNLEKETRGTVNSEKETPFLGLCKLMEEEFWWIRISIEGKFGIVLWIDSPNLRVVFVI